MPATSSTVGKACAFQQSLFATVSGTVKITGMKVLVPATVSPGSVQIMSSCATFPSDAFPEVGTATVRKLFEKSCCP